MQLKRQKDRMSHLIAISSLLKIIFPSSIPNIFIKIMIIGIREVRYVLICFLFIMIVRLNAFKPAFQNAIRKTLQHSGLYMSTISDERIKAERVSLDTNLIASNSDLVLSHLKSRRSSQELINDMMKIGDLRSQRNTLIQEGDAAKSERKSLSQKIGMLMKEKKEDEVGELKAQVEKANAISAAVDEKLNIVDNEINRLFSVLPNLLDDSVPDGDDETSNPIITIWGEDKRKVGEGYAWHDELAIGVGGLDVDAASRISGARFSVLKGPIARLERALSQYFLDFHINRDYTEVSVPYIVTRSTLEGTGQLPKFEDDLFKVSHDVGGEDAFLIPTAEVPVTNLFKQQLIDKEDLPIYYTCHSPSFRAEAGSYGRDTRGLLRQHQFHKVELIKICEPETSEEEHEKMTNDSEELLKTLGLPHRKVLLCSGDIGFSARKCYDLEVWLPGQQEYREIASISNCFDFQARRMSLRYRTAKQGSGKKRATAYPHTLNGSGVAVGRALVAILENYQNVDGSITIPDVLKNYMGGLDKIEIKKD